MTKATSWAAVIFMLTSLFLAYQAASVSTGVKVEDFVKEKPSASDLPPGLPGGDAAKDTAGSASGDTADKTGGDTGAAAGGSGGKKTMDVPAGAAQPGAGAGHPGAQAPGVDP